jgi:hypothetical protein
MSMSATLAASEGGTTVPEDHYAVPANVSPENVPIGKELARLEESARWSSQNQFEAAKSWQRWNFRLGVPASFFGLFSGGAAITEAFPGWLIGGAALVGAALTGIMTVLAAERRAQRAKTCANTFHDIQDDARRTLLIDLPGMAYEDARAALTALTDRYSETRQAADTPTDKFYRRAAKNLRTGGQRFAIDVAKAAPTPAQGAIDPPQPTASAAHPEVPKEN